jgi:signal transduction histidine kinase
VGQVGDATRLLELVRAEDARPPLHHWGRGSYRPIGRIPESAEVAAYYVVAEALTNATRHAHASRTDIDVSTDGSERVLSIRVEGVGGADSSKGSGPIGLIDRVEALGGHIPT